VSGIVFTPYEFSEAAVPKVEIVFTSGDIRRRASTDERGQYRILLPAGTYQVTADRPGFCFCSIDRRVRIAGNPETMINFRLIVCAFGTRRRGGPGQEGNPGTRMAGISAEDGNGTCRCAWRVSARTRLRVRQSNQPEQTNAIHRCGYWRSQQSAAAIYDALVIYADSIAIDENSMLLKAEGHVIVEDARTRRRASVDTVRLDAGDVVGSVRIDANKK